MPSSSHDKPSESPSSRASTPRNATPPTQTSAQRAAPASSRDDTELEIDVILDSQASGAARVDEPQPPTRAESERHTSVPLSPPTLLSQPPPPPLDESWPLSESRRVTIPTITIARPSPPTADAPSSVIELESLDELLIAEPPSQLGDMPSRPSASSHRALRPTLLPPAHAANGAPSGLIDLKQLLGHLPPHKAPPAPRVSRLITTLSPQPQPLWAAPAPPLTQQQSDGPWQQMTAQAAARAAPPPQHPERSTIRPIATSLLPTAPEHPRMRSGAVGLVITMAALFAFHIIRGNTAPAAPSPATPGEVQASVLAAPAPKVTVLDEVLIEVDPRHLQPEHPDDVANVMLGDERGPALSTARHFDELAAQSLLASGAQQVQSCRKRGESAGVVKVTVTFAPSGRATHVKLTGDYVGTATGACISDTFHKLWVQPFDGPLATISKRVLLR